jgi:ribosomal protein L44E
MKPLSIKCPHCGSHASLSAEKAKSQNISHAEFHCDNRQCNRKFYGELILTRAPIPGMERFSTDAPDPANPGKVLTDC